jgi:hypothetical protein
MIYYENAANPPSKELRCRRVRQLDVDSRPLYSPSAVAACTNAALVAGLKPIDIRERWNLFIGGAAVFRKDNVLVTI